MKGSDRQALLVGPVLIGVGGAAMAAGSLLPWVTAAAPYAVVIDANGLHGGEDGLLALVDGVALVLLALVAAAGWAAGPICATVLAAFGLVVMAFEASSAHARVEQLLAVSPYVHPTVGAGVAIVAVGATVAAAGGIVDLLRREGRGRPWNMR